MKNIIIMILLAITATTILALDNTEFYYSHKQKIELKTKEGEIAVKLVEKVSELHRKELLSQFPTIELVKEFSELNICILETKSNLSNIDYDLLLKKLERVNYIEYAHPVFYSKKVMMIATNEFYVQFNEYFSEDNISILNSIHNVEIVKEIEGLNNTYILKMIKKDIKGIIEIANEYYEMDCTKFAHPDFVQTINATEIYPNDPQFDNQWGLHNTGQTGGSTDADIDAVEGWEFITGSNETIIAVLDTGVDINHEDLQGNLVSGINAITGSSNQQPYGCVTNAHGTACAGIIAASTNNSTGISGVTWNSNIMPIKIMHYDNMNEPPTTTFSAISAGIMYATLNGADVISNSWGGGSLSDIITASIQSAKNSGRNGKGCLIVFSSGNENSSVLYPAILPEVIAVGATNENDERCSPSHWGVGQGSHFGPELDVVAPGNHIVTIDIMGLSGYSNNNYNSNFTGTSAATPFVSGLGALIIGYRPEFTADQVQQLIQNTADDQVGDPSEDVEGWDQFMGYGRININNALSAIRDVYLSGHITEDAVWDSTHIYIITNDLIAILYEYLSVFYI